MIKNMTTKIILEEIDAMIKDTSIREVRECYFKSILPCWDNLINYCKTLSEIEIYKLSLEVKMKRPLIGENLFKQIKQELKQPNEK